MGSSQDTKEIMYYKIEKIFSDDELIEQTLTIGRPDRCMLPIELERIRSAGIRLSDSGNPPIYAIRQNNLYLYINETNPFSMKLLDEFLTNIRTNKDNSEVNIYIEVSDYLNNNTLDDVLER